VCVIEYIFLAGMRIQSCEPDPQYGLRILMNLYGTTGGGSELRYWFHIRTQRIWDEYFVSSERSWKTCM